MAISAWLLAFEAERVLFRVALIGLSLDRLALAVRGAIRRGPPPPSLPADRSAWPFVTVQLPMRNERFVAERVIRACAALDWPKERLEIQVLDNSDDETSDIVRGVADELCSAGSDVVVVPKGAEGGEKATSLAQGMKSAKGDHFAIFDADFVPAPTFLLETMPHFLADPRIGMVQGRWSYLNERKSLLTRVQAVMLDALMTVEQAVQSREDRTFQFNGTAGVWRRECIDRAGGWSRRTVTEDRDLSYRAIMAGYRFIHLPEVAAATELPEAMFALRVQQQRWTRGASQIIRIMAFDILSSGLSVARRFELFRHVARRLIAFSVLLVAIVSFPLTTFQVVEPLVEYSVASDAVVIALVLCALTAFFARGQANIGRSPWRAIALAPFAALLHVGLSLAMVFATAGGFVRKHASFERTPKLAGRSPSSLGDFAKPDFTVVSELAVFVAYALFMVMLARRGLGPHAAWCAAVAVAYAWVGFGGVAELGRRVAMKMRRAPSNRASSRANEGW